MKILTIIFIIIFFTLTIAYFIIGNYFYNIALNSNTSKEFILGETSEKQDNLLDKNAKDIYISTSSNGDLKLHSYEITNNSDIWVIVIHGYNGKSEDMVYFAKEYYNKGYNVLVVDLRGHGQSQGDYIGMGWHDRLDIIDWANYIINKNTNCKIILHGVSMGAATVMMATGEKLPENVKIAIEDCGYTSIWDLSRSLWYKI